MSTEEGTLEIEGFPLFTKTWQTENSPVCKLIFIHGFNDHCDRYYELFPSLTQRGIQVHSFDQRGWGRSVTTTKHRGQTGPTAQVIADTACFIKQHLPSDIPVFVMGHSMGGGQVLTLASTPEYEDIIKQVSGWLLESPFIAFPKGFEPNSVEVFIGKIAARVIPAFQRLSGLPVENLTRDPEVMKSCNEDQLLHGYGTLSGLSGMLERTAALGDGTAKISPSVERLWLAHGTEDKGTSYEASKTWFDKAGQKPGWTFKSYEGWSHQLHADLPETRPIFQKDVADWILAQVADIKGSTPKL